MKQNRMRSPVLWGAVAAIMLLILKAFGFDEAVQLASGRAEELFNLICAAMAVLGVLNNPTEGGKF